MSNKKLMAKAAFNLTIRSVSFSSDGSQLAIGHGDGSFRVLKGRYAVTSNALFVYIIDDKLFS